MKAQTGIDTLIADCCVGECIDMPNRLPRDCEFTGKKVVFTGFSTVQKDVMLNVAECCGMIPQSTVCKSTQCLICGDNAGPSKLQRAREQGVEIMTAFDFFLRIGVEPPSWTNSVTENPELAERKKYIDFFQNLPMETLRQVYKILTNHSDDVDVDA